MIFLIARKELRGLFFSSQVWFVLAAIQIWLGYLFFLLVQNYLNNAEARGSVSEDIVQELFKGIGAILLLVVPLITMRMISEERRSGTLSLLCSAPITASQIIVGKFIGCFGFALFVIGVASLMPLSLIIGTELDWMRFFACIIGTSALAGFFVALGLFASSLTQQPMIAAVISLLALLGLGSVSETNDIEYQLIEKICAYLPWLPHYYPALGGTLDTAHIGYFVAATLLFLVLATRRLAMLTNRP